MTQNDILRMAHEVGLQGSQDAVLRFAAKLAGIRPGDAAKLRRNLRIPDRILLALQAKPMSRHSLESALRISRPSATAYLTRLHFDELVHIVRWQADSAGRCNTPVYALGAGKDAPMPPAKPPKPRARRPQHASATSTPRTTHPKRCTLPVHTPFRTVFAGGVNPWTGCRTETSTRKIKAPTT